MIRFNSRARRRLVDHVQSARRDRRDSTRDPSSQYADLARSGTAYSVKNRRPASRPPARRVEIPGCSAGAEHAVATLHAEPRGDDARRLVAASSSESAARPARCAARSPRGSPPSAAAGLNRRASVPHFGLNSGGITLHGSIRSDLKVIDMGWDLHRISFTLAPPRPRAFTFTLRTARPTLGTRRRPPKVLPPQLLGRATHDRDRPAAGQVSSSRAATGKRSAARGRPVWTTTMSAISSWPAFSRIYGSSPVSGCTAR